MIKCEGRGIPIGVFRPSIGEYDAHTHTPSKQLFVNTTTTTTYLSVISTYREPIKAWINNLYGPTGVCAGAGTGVLRTMHCHPKVNANIVPVDMVVNAMIACGWEIAKNYEENKLKADYEIPVYNYESSNDKPINWGEYMSYSETSGVLYPSVKAIWYYFLTLQPTWIGYFITQLFLHYIPALIVDGALLCVGKSPMYVRCCSCPLISPLFVYFLGC